MQKTTKQTLRQRLGTGIVLAAAGFGSFVAGGCVETAQDQRVYTLTGMSYDYVMQEKRNEAIRNSGSQVNIYMNGNNDNSFLDDINSPEKVARRKAEMDRLKAEGRW